MEENLKQLLLKDLCGRLPYGVIVAYKSPFGESDIKVTCYNIGYVLQPGNDWWSECKPYLRPMSSMTEDEKEEIEVFIFNEWYQENSCKIDKEGWIEILANYDVSGIDPCFCSDYIDWLNAHHFDYRGLIEKGLALEAPEEMYD